MQIQTAESFYHPMAMVVYVPPPDHPEHHSRLARVNVTPTHLLPALMFALGAKPTGRHKKLKVQAVVEEARWIVKCPYCPSAQMASHSSRWFYCSECLMREGAGKEVEVVWPDEADQITTHLSLRPMGASANWVPGESLAQLHEENVALGLAPAWSTP